MRTLLRHYRAGRQPKKVIVTVNYYYIEIEEIEREIHLHAYV